MAVRFDPSNPANMSAPQRIAEVAAILVAGVVTTFMRFFASLDIVGEKIQGWLTDDRYLEKLAAKKSLTVTLAPSLAAAWMVWFVSPKAMGDVSTSKMRSGSNSNWIFPPPPL